MKAGIDYIGIMTAFYCNDGKGKFLFAKRSIKCRDEQGAWEPGGGQLEFGESPEEGVLRECLEEYSCRGVIQEKLPSIAMIREHDGQKTHWLVFPFFILINPSEAKIGEPEAIDEIGWFDMDNLPTPLHKGFAQTLQVLRPHFEKYQSARI